MLTPARQPSGASQPGGEDGVLLAPSRAASQQSGTAATGAAPQEARGDRQRTAPPGPTVWLEYVVARGGRRILLQGW